MKPEIETLQSIIRYCEAIQDDRRFFGDDKDYYLDDERYQRSVTFSLF